MNILSDQRIKVEGRVNSFLQNNKEKLKFVSDFKSK